jgi:DNA-binding NarL/FixJ family response regulator
MFKIIIIENSPLLQIGWQTLISSHFKDYEIHFLQSDDSLETNPVLHTTPDIIILSLHSQTNKTHVEQIQASMKNQEFPILVYYSIDKSEKAIEFLKTGATGCIANECDLSTIARAISNVMEGNKFICPITEQKVIEQFLYVDLPTKNKSQILSDRELEIAQFIVKGMRTSEISKRLNLQMSTISTVKYKIFSKMNVNSAIQLAQKLQNS